MSSYIDTCTLSTFLYKPKLLCNIKWSLNLSLFKVHSLVEASSCQKLPQTKWILDNAFSLHAFKYTMLPTSATQEGSNGT